MGDYASSSDITERFPAFGITSTSTPSTADVDNFITDVELEVNAIVESIGYSSPIATTAPVSHGLIKSIVINGVASLTAENLMFAVDADYKLSERYAKRYDKSLASLRANPAMLRDATAGSDYSADGGGQGRDTDRWSSDDRDDNDDIPVMFGNDLEY